MTVNALPEVVTVWGVLDPELAREEINAAFSGLTGRLLGKLLRANLNTTGDQPIAISAPSYVVLDILVTNASTAPSGAEDGNFYSAPAAAGFPLLVVQETLSPPSTCISGLGVLTSPALWVDLRLGMAVPSSVLSGPNLYLHLTEPDGSPCLVDIYVFGLAWPPEN